MEFLIGSRASDFLSVKPVEREHPDASDFWDGNWLITEIEIAVGAFRARYVANLRVDELLRLRDQMSALPCTLDGQAELRSLEDWLQVSIQGDDLGHFQVDCQAKDAAGIGNTLKFALGFDQTELSGMLDELEQIIEKFPLLGERGE